MWGNNTDNQLLSDNKSTEIKRPTKQYLLFNQRSYEPVSVCCGPSYTLVLGKRIPNEEEKDADLHLWVDRDAEEFTGEGTGVLNNEMTELNRKPREMKLLREKIRQKLKALLYKKGSLVPLV